MDMVSIGVSLITVLLLGMIAVVVFAIVALLFSRGKGAAGIVVGICVLGLMVLLGIGAVLTVGLYYRRAVAVQHQAIELEQMHARRAEIEARRQALQQVPQPPDPSGSQRSQDAAPAIKFESEAIDVDTSAPLAPPVPKTPAPPVEGAETGEVNAAEDVAPDDVSETGEASNSDVSEPDAHNEPETAAASESTSASDAAAVPADAGEPVGEAASDQEDESPAVQEDTSTASPDDPSLTDVIHDDAEATEGTFVKMEEMPADTSSDAAVSPQDIAVVENVLNEQDSGDVVSEEVASIVGSVFPEGVYIPTPSSSAADRATIETSPQATERPAWVGNPPATIDGHYATVLVSDPFETRFLCDADLDRRARQAIVKYAQSFAHARGYGSVPGNLPITDADIADITQERFYVLRPTSLGEMTVGYELIVFSDAVHAKLEHRIQDAVVDQRIAWAGVLSGGALAMLTSVFGISHLLARKSPDPLAS